MMLPLLSGLVGCVLLIAALAILWPAPSCEVSIRTASAFGIGAWGALMLAQAIKMETPDNWGALVLPASVALWAGRAMWNRRGQVMRRSTDWVPLDPHHPMTGTSQ